MTWLEQGACRDTHPDLFYSDEHRAVAKAKAICADCPVREECGEYGLHEPYGVWGGRGVRDRRAERHRRTLARRRLAGAVA